MNGKTIASAADPASAPLSPPVNPPPRILVVDDNKDIRQLNVEALARAGYTVDAAEDGAAAWEAINSECYDLLITDNKMPNVTGVELLEMLQGAHMVLPVIMASGNLPSMNSTVSPWLKPTATLCKPYRVEALVQTVREILGGPGSMCMG